MAELQLGNIKPAGADNVVVDSKYVKGGYITVANISERDALVNANTKNIVKGSLCYCQADNNYYKYNGTSWEPEFVVDSTLSDTSTNAIQNKVVKEALDDKADFSHGNHVPTTTDHNNKKFLRSDNTWADVTPANIGAIPSTEKGAANGVATLDDNGLVPSSQLPSFVDDVIEGYYQESSNKFYESYNEKNGSYDKELPSEGGKIYVDLNNKKTYRWGGPDSGFVVISETIAIGTTTGTALDGKIGHDHITNDLNPHNVTKAQVGLGNVDNTADMDKRVAYAEEAGHATRADSATKDASGNVITETYATKSELQTNTNDHATIRGEISELSGQVEELLKVDGDTLGQLEEILKDLENSDVLLEKKLEIIDVDALPTDNIDTNVLYRVFTATLIHNRHVVDNSTCYIVDTLPEVGEVATDDQQSFIKAYYSVNDNTLYGYLDETLAYGFSQLAGTTLAAGWYPASNLLPMAGWPYEGVITNIVDDLIDSKIRLLLETKIYCYQNDWVELTNSAVNEKLPIPERDGHFAYTVQRRDGKDAYELHLISHSINEAYKDGELMYPHQIPLRENGIIKTAEPKEDLDAANKKYVDTMVEDLHKKILGAPTEGLEYELSDDGTYYTCIGIGTATDTDIVIASEIDGKPVTSIGDRAFEDCYESLTSVVIGDSVTSIGTCAFTCCRSLTSVVIGDSVESIGDQAFDGCSSLTSVVIGDSITYIGSSAFASCSLLKSIVIPDSVTSIGSHAFYWCDSLTIYCKYKENEIPEGWNAEWNYLTYYSNCPVVWGFANDFVEVDKKLTENYAPRMTKFDESWGHNRIYYIKNAQLTEEGEIPTTAELSVEVPAGKSIMVCALQDDNNESDYSYIDANGLPIEPPIEYGWEGALATPVVTINDNVASWSAVDGATHYSYLIGTPTAYNSTSNSFANTYNRVYVERTKNRGVYSRYALSSANAPVDPDPADFARNICLDSIPMRMSNGYIMAPPIYATDTAALDKIAERGYSLDYYLMPKRYTDSYTENYTKNYVTEYVTGNVPVGFGTGKSSVIINGSVAPAKVSGDYATALGELNEVSGKRGFSTGYINKVAGNCGAAFGQNVSAKAWLCFGAGYGLNVDYEKQAVFGTFNAPKEKDSMGYKLLFSVGNGSSDSKRSNAFEIYADGRATIGRAPVYDMDVANKGFVTSQISTLNTQLTAKIKSLETKINNSSMDDSIFDIVLNLQTGAN